MGIAEEHAVTFSAGLAAGGMKPVFAVYSSFLQRAYDQLLHDVCLQNLPVVIAIDRAGLVGNDGETHQGGVRSVVPLFDSEYDSDVTEEPLGDGGYAPFCSEFPVSHRAAVSPGSSIRGNAPVPAPIEYGKSEMIRRESDIAVIFVGHMAQLALSVYDGLKERGYSCTLVNARFVKPLDTEMLTDLAKDHRLFVTIEENVIIGGFGEQVIDYVSRSGLDVHVRNIGIPDDYVEHGNVDLLRKEVGLDRDTIIAQVLEDLGRESRQITEKDR